MSHDPRDMEAAEALLDLSRGQAEHEKIGQSTAMDTNVPDKYDAEQVAAATTLVSIRHKESERIESSTSMDIDAPAAQSSAAETPAANASPAETLAAKVSEADTSAADTQIEGGQDGREDSTDAVAPQVSGEPTPFTGGQKWTPWQKQYLFDNQHLPRKEIGRVVGKTDQACRLTLLKMRNALKAKSSCTPEPQTMAADNGFPAPEKEGTPKKVQEQSHKVRKPKSKPKTRKASRGSIASQSASTLTGSEDQSAETQQPTSTLTEPEDEPSDTRSQLAEFRFLDNSREKYYIPADKLPRVEYQRAQVEAYFKPVPEDPAPDHASSALDVPEDSARARARVPSAGHIHEAMSISRITK